MPLTAKGERILEAMQKEYGHKKGEQVFYASINAGTIEGAEKDMATKKKTTRKKRRSAKQRANDKRLGQMARKRAAARRKANPKKKAKRKTKRKANPKRTKSAKSHLWVVFKCRGKSVHYFTGNLAGNGRQAWGKRADGARFVTKGVAERHARFMAKKRGASKFNIGVAPDILTSHQIGAQCNSGK